MQRKFQSAFTTITNPDEAGQCGWQNLVLGLFLEPRLVASRCQGLRFTAAQLAQKIFFRLKLPAGKLSLMAMIANFVGTTMATIAIDDSRVSMANTA